jgi:diguanylate cyclase (GGDEF)-like protein
MDGRSRADQRFRHIRAPEGDPERSRPITRTGHIGVGNGQHCPRAADLSGVTDTGIASAEPAVIRWLRGDASDRRRYAAMHTRFQKAYHFAAAIAVTKVLAAFWYGPWLLVLLALGTITMAVGRAAHRRARQPEVVTSVTFFALQLITAVSVLVSGGATSPLLPLMAIPIFSQAVCFRPQVFLAGVGLNGLLVVPAVLLADPSATTSPPVVHLVGYLGLLISLSVGGYSLATADRASRDEAVIDPMTGLYNRLTLAARFGEAQRSVSGTNGSVGLVMVDVDHFKRVNDTHGHDRGDRVLRELAERLVGNLRTSDVAYRVGGEEFVVLLPGRDAEGARAVAERIRASVATVPLAGLPVTVSAGVVTGDGDASLEELMRAADVALYAAKAGGRDRVVGGDGGTRRPERVPAP